MGGMPVSRRGYTLRVDGRPVASGGALPTSDGGFHLWAVIAPGAPMLAVTRATLRFLETLGPAPFVATVPCDFEAGHRWARLLGFERCETVKRYSDGVDHVAYRRGLTWRRTSR
jgi:hypothetical protein